MLQSALTRSQPVTAKKRVRKGDILLPLPHVHQGYNAGCGLGAMCMVFNYHGLDVNVAELERHPLVLPRMLRKDGIGPGRLGRIALSLGFPVQIVDPSARDVGKSFVREGGDWVAEAPKKSHILHWLYRGVPVVACIPDKTLAFEGCKHHGSHWITLRGVESGELLLRDPAPWRSVERCKPGYWDIWSCTMLAIQPPG